MTEISVSSAGAETAPGLAPFSLKDAPAFIELQFPVGRLSAEVFKERDAKQAQTLTALGSYWKGRKPLILVRAVVMGCLLPATNDADADLDVFLRLMAMDDAAFGRRFNGSATDYAKLFPDHAPLVATNLYRVWRRDVPTEQLRALATAFMASASFHLADEDRADRDNTVEAIQAFALSGRSTVPSVDAGQFGELFPYAASDLTQLVEGRWRWRADISPASRAMLIASAFATIPYAKRLQHVRRPEECEEEALLSPIWPSVNRHLGTDVQNMTELVEQLGIARFGRRPVVADTFSGGGSIPFEAARIGCDVSASDLNPIACMLTWSAFNLVGATGARRMEIEVAQSDLAAAVDREVTLLGIEHDAEGNRAKAYLYCLETRCPKTGWMVPMAPSWVISPKHRVIARLIPDHKARRYEIEIKTGATAAELAIAEHGTIRGGRLVHPMNDERSGVEIKTVRGDFKDNDGRPRNQLRLWEKEDISPHPDDIFQERLYCIQWISRETIGKGRQYTYFRGVMKDDVARENQVTALVRNNIRAWQSEGIISDAPIATGKENEGPIRTNGWTYWHHMFGPRQIHLASIILKNSKRSTLGYIMLAKSIDYLNKSCQWRPKDAYVEQLFSRPSLKTQHNWASRGAWDISETIRSRLSTAPVRGAWSIENAPAVAVSKQSDVFVTDPPYADSIRYEEITEFFISWLRKRPPSPFDQWTWDSQRRLAIKGKDEQFRRDMVAAYAAMTSHMPDHGQQVVMFTHQDAGVWADLGSILWAAGLRITAAWNIVTETESALKEGNYVQGTVCLVLRKRLGAANARRMEIEAEIEEAVAAQLAHLNALDDAWHERTNAETLYTDGDLTLAAYAAALQVVTAYSSIDRQPLDRDLYRKLAKGETTMLRDLVDYAAQVANSLLVPEGFPRDMWRDLLAAERFYVRMLDMEAKSSAKVADFQNFAKSFAFGGYADLMASTTANAAALAGAADLKGRMLDGEGFGGTQLRQVLFAIWKTMEGKELDPKRGVTLLKSEYNLDYWTRRQKLIALAGYVALKTARTRPPESAAAHDLAEALKLDRV